MSPEQLQLILLILQAARAGLRQVGASGLDNVPQDLKDAVLAERDQLLDDWRRLAPA